MYRFTALFTDWRNMAEFGQAFLKPNFLDWRTYVSDMIVTVQIAIWGTVLAAVVGAPFAILASSNISPAWIVQPVRRLMDACRAINEIVFALLFVVAVGLGPFAGVMALFIHNVGVFSKLYSEAVEAIDPRPVEGIRATGARRLPEIIFGVIPQVIPLWSSYALYRLENQCALRHHARHCRRRRHRPDALREHSLVPLWRDSRTDDHCRADRHDHRHAQRPVPQAADLTNDVAEKKKSQRSGKRPRNARDFNKDIRK